MQENQDAGVKLNTIDEKDDQKQLELGRYLKLCIHYKS